VESSLEDNSWNGTQLPSDVRSRLACFRFPGNDLNFTPVFAKVISPGAAVLMPPPCWLRLACV